MPRKPKHPGGRPVTVNAAIARTWRLDPETLEKIARLAAEWGCSQAEVVRRIVRNA